MERKHYRVIVTGYGATSQPYNTRKMANETMLHAIKSRRAINWTVTGTLKEGYTMTRPAYGSSPAQHAALVCESHQGEWWDCTTCKITA